MREDHDDLVSKGSYPAPGQVIRDSEFDAEYKLYCGYSGYISQSVASRDGFDLLEWLHSPMRARALDWHARGQKQNPPKPRTLAELSDADRKGLPIMTGVLDYFPDALLAVAAVSKAGNDQHNPGQPLHWAKGKSTDHADCVGRHLIQRGTLDKDGQRHTAKAAWRVLATLQMEIEAERAGMSYADYIRKLEAEENKQ